MSASEKIMKILEELPFTEQVAIVYALTRLYRRKIEKMEKEVKK